MISGGCAYVYTTCRVGVLSSEISKHSKISPPPSLRSHLTSSPMGVLSGYWITTNHKDTEKQKESIAHSYIAYIIRLMPGISKIYQPLRQCMPGSLGNSSGFTLRTSLASAGDNFSLGR